MSVRQTSQTTFTRESEEKGRTRLAFGGTTGLNSNVTAKEGARRRQPGNGAVAKPFASTRMLHDGTESRTMGWARGLTARISRMIANKKINNYCYGLATYKEQDGSAPQPQTGAFPWPNRWSWW